LPKDPARNRTDLAKQQTLTIVEVTSNKSSTNQEGRGGGRRGIPSEPPEDQQGTAGGGDRRRKMESERGKKKGRTRAMEARMGVTLAPTSPVRFYACTAPSPALPPILPAKHHPVLAGEGSSRAADGLVPNDRGEVHGAVQISGASQGTKHGPPARPRPGWAFGRPHTCNQTRP
jgi:hypothetical protein